jgi:hypothetical protein
MESAELVLISVSAFLWVFIILCLLALLMRMLMWVFPGVGKGMDPAVLAAVTTVLQTALPGTKVTKIEERP